MQSPEPSLPLPLGIVPGKKFHQLTILHRVANDQHGRVRVLVRCDCPDQNELTVRLTDLKRGQTKSCGCARIQAIRRRCGPVQFRRFGCYGAFGKANPEEKMSRVTTWLVICDYCGKIAFLKTWQLRTLRYRCPCLKETYNSWRNMIQRCNNPNHDQYEDYGGRGIRVHANWINFAGFLADMGKRPPGRTLDRINVHGHYTLLNCRWSTPEEQAWNRRPPVRDWEPGANSEEVTDISTVI